jgi:uncharacterized protein YhbP (UPF0306 family)
MTEKVPVKIVDFIKEHHVLTMASCKDGIPWCANCFYVWLNDEQAFVFTSDLDTRHIKDTIEKPIVAGSVLLETRTVGKIRGLQFQATMEKAEDNLYKVCRKSYIKKYPYAVLAKTELWLLRVSHFKMTDNRLGFGKKQYWGVAI